MKFFPVGKDLGEKETQALKLKFKEDAKHDEIVVLGHTDQTRQRIGGMNAKKFVKHIIKKAGVKKSEIKHIHLIGCEAGFVNEKGESLAQAIADEFKNQGCSEVVVHAISNKNKPNAFVEYVGMRVEVVGETSKLHQLKENIENGYVRGFAYRTQEALTLEDRLSDLPAEIRKANEEMQRMPERIGHDLNAEKNLVRKKLAELRQEEFLLIQERENKKKYFKQSNLLTNLEVLLSQTKKGHLSNKPINLSDENVNAQLMFQEKLNGMKQEKQTFENQQNNSHN